MISRKFLFYGLKQQSILFPYFFLGVREYSNFLKVKIKPYLFKPVLVGYAVLCITRCMKNYTLSSIVQKLCGGASRPSMENTAKAKLAGGVPPH